MKCNKQITIDVELNEKLLKESNASLLINRLIKEHYEKTENPYKEMTEEEKLKEIAKMDIKLEAIRQIKALDGVKHE